MFFPHKNKYTGFHFPYPLPLARPSAVCLFVMCLQSVLSLSSASSQRRESNDFPLIYN